MNFLTKMNDFPTWNNHYDRNKEYFNLILDYFGSHVQMLLNSQGINQISMQAPLSVVYGFLDKNILIGFTADKATFLSSSISFVKMDLIDEETGIEVLKNAARKELGLEVKYFTTISKDYFFEVDDEKLGIINQAILIDNFSHRGQFLDNFPDFYIPIVDSATKFVLNIIKEDVKLMKFNPIFKARELTVDEKMVFYIMPFKEEQEGIFKVLKKELEEKGLQVIRADSIFSNNDVMEDIWTYINKAKFVIADLSGANPNVFYELGICHSIGKDVIPICDSSSLESDYNGKLPFDINTRRTVFYKNTIGGFTDLQESLSKTVDSIITGTTVIV